MAHDIFILTLPRKAHEAKLPLGKWVIGMISSLNYIFKKLFLSKSS